MPYDPVFSRVYDIIVHGEADSLAGAAELAVIGHALAGTSGPVRDILDAGCGRGRFLIPLAEAGYRLTGIDFSPGMVEGCLERLAARGLDATVTVGDLEALDASQAYDAVICMDSVVCYFLETERVLGLLQRLRQALRPGGVLVVDIWNILGNWPLFGKTVRGRHDADNLQVAWKETYRFQSVPAVLQMDISGWCKERGPRQRFSHTGVLRVFTPDEFVMLLEAAGFRGVTVQAGYEPDDEEQLVFTGYAG